MSVRFDLTELARGVAPDQALAWWTDFREGRADHGFVPGQKRRILGRAKDGAVTMEDKSAFIREVTTARVEADRVVFEGVNTFSRFVGSYQFSSAEKGTIVRLEADVELRPGLRFSEAVARPIARALLRADLRAHVKEMRRDLTPTGDIARAVDA